MRPPLVAKLKIFIYKKLEVTNCDLQFSYPNGWNLFPRPSVLPFSFMQYASVDRCSDGWPSIALVLSCIASTSLALTANYFVSAVLPLILSGSWDHFHLRC